MGGALLCTGVGLHEEGLSLELRESPSEKLLRPLEPGREIAFIVRGERHCIGYRPPGSQSLLPCPHNVQGIGSTQCPDCFAAAKILPCLRCDGERCRNPERRRECVQPANHAVYLASFGPGRPKVGVARWERRRERLLEQGARAALIVARDDGQLVRRTEQQIRRSGIPDRLSSAEKLIQLTQAASPADLEGELTELAASLRHRIRAAWLDEVEVVDLPRPPLLERVPRLITPEAGLRLRGTIESISGQLVIVAADTSERIAIDASTLVGYPIGSLDPAQGGSGQMALAFG